MALGWPGPLEMVILAGLGLLIFGKRLPEVGRSVGKTIVEFKKGMREVEEELKNPDTTPTPTQSLPTQAPNALPQGHKFDPYTGKPIVQEAETTTTR
jgi:sec-independent protein translocase protein TatA